MLEGKIVPHDTMTPCSNNGMPGWQFKMSRDRDGQAGDRTCIT
jgi:hypothetical protein